MCFLSLLLAAALGASAQPAPIQLPSITVSSTTAELHAAALTGEPVGLLDTPRAYSSISETQLNDYRVRLSDLAAFTSSVQVPGTYGATATVNVRGDMAELYQNGQRRTDNAAGFQPSFNGVEQIDIVKGAAPIVFGPGFYSGGYLNLTTKKATSIQRTITSLTLGDLSADHSYLNATVGLDTNQPLNAATSIRLSYEGRENATLYRAARDDSQDVYLTLRRELPSSTLDLSLEHLWQATPQVEGINRPTQRLIWDRAYASDTGPRQLAATDNLVSPGDLSNANVTTAQAVYALGTSFRSYTLVESVARRRFNAFAYAEYARQFTADQRVEWHWDGPAGYVIAGAQARYEWRQSFTNYFNAFFDAYDITRPAPRDASRISGYALGHPGPGGRLFFGPLDGNADTTESRVYQFAPFIQHRVHLGAYQVLYGVRADGFRVFVKDPLTHAASDDLTTYSTSRMLSVIRSMGNWSVYGTYARLYSVNGTVSGGGIVLAPDLRINEANLRSLNRLYEAGVRRETAKGDTLRLTAFHQARQQPDLYAYKPNDIVVRGVELEWATKSGSWYQSTSITYQEGSFVNSLPFELPSATLASVSVPGNYRIPGLSRIYVAKTVGYQGKRWGMSISPRWQSEQTGTSLGGYHIPSQGTVDAQVSWKGGSWAVVLNARNVTNRFNWVHNGDSFGDTAVIHHAPLFNASLSVRYITR